MTVTEFLRSQVPFLNGLEDEPLLDIAKSLDQHVFGKGQTVVFKGVTVDGLHIVASGRVSVESRSQKSKAVVTVAELGPGQIFGETSIMEHCTAGATIKCLDEGTLIYILPQDSFCELLKKHPRLQERAEALIAERKANSKAVLGTPSPRSAP